MVDPDTIVARRSYLHEVPKATRNLSDTPPYLGREETIHPVDNDFFTRKARIIHRKSYLSYAL